ncbi:MAG: hypothetical protein N3G22_02515 [Candidatus Micrarchaeota archaeon]|nr:hypothetical protein [Candidatus Micrarchaeota archaeon]
MARKEEIWFAIFAAILIFFSGCAMNVPASEKFSRLEITPEFPPDRNQLICKDADGPQPCWCFFCENKTSWYNIFSFLSDYFDATLVKGNCSIVSCNVSQANATLTKNDNIQLRVVAVGAGPSFVSADKANRYCNQSLQFAVKWMKGSYTAPRVPNASRAECWLRRNTLPIFIYYTNSTYISADTTIKIAKEFERDGGVGPVLVTNEINFNSSSDPQLRAVRAQIIALDSCKKCLTVLAVKSGDYNALEKLLGDSTKYPTLSGVYKNISEMVDIVGFGFRNTDYKNCSVAQIISENFDFSRNITITYGKPTVWLYVGISQGKSIDGSCEWTETKVHDFYQNLFAITDAMSSAGILGFSLYEFSDGHGPLPCNGIQGCTFGLFDSSGAQKHPEINSWSTPCQYFGTSRHRSAMIFSKSGYGSKCEAWKNVGIFNILSSSINMPASMLDKTEVPKGERPRDSSGDIIPGIGCGEVCVASNPMPKKIYNDAGSRFTFRSDLCYEYGDREIYSKIDELADDEDISSNYMRALFRHNNPLFNEKEVFCVNKTNTYCNPLNLNMRQICQLSGISPYDCPPECQYDWEKPCSFGLAQCKEYPGRLYANTGRPLPQDIKLCGGADYNPFNASLSICCGIKKFRRLLDDSTYFLNQKWHLMNKSACTGGMGAADRGWADYFVATLLYENESISLDNYLSEFLLQRDTPDKCAGEEHFIAFTRQYSNYSAEVMTIYLDALDKCESDCPGD